MTGLFLCAVLIGWVIATVFGALGWWFWCDGIHNKKYALLPVAVLTWAIDFIALGVYIRAMYHLFMLP